MSKFGRTWWGEQWLNALDRIDFSNRLDRGRAYAKNGSVRSINIKEHMIEAKVQGSQRSPYKVTIVVPPFFDNEKEIILKNISSNNLILSKLLNRELPNELLQIAEANNIKIFPKSWQDIKLNCSCPDWAVPCKHLAAVIYLVANEIDQNPFLVFKLHKFDIIDELSKLKIEVGKLEEEKIARITDFIIPINDSNQKAKKSKTPIARIAPDFSKIENLLQIIPHLFIANPLFYTSNFKEVINTVYKKVSKLEYLSLLEKKHHKIQEKNDLRYANYSISLNIKLNYKIHVDSTNNSDNISLNKMEVIQFQQLNNLLAQTESKHLDAYTDSFIFLYRTFRFCNKIVERGAIIPKLFATDEKQFKIQWIPALINESILEVFEALLCWLPDNMVSFESEPIEKTKKSKSSKENTIQKIEHFSLNKSDSLQLICSIFINHSISHCYNSGPLLKSKSNIDLKIINLFFNDQLISFMEFGEKEIPNTIQLWLKRFHFESTEFTPVISVSEKEGKFEVETLVQNNTNKLVPLQTFSKFVNATPIENQMNLLKDLNLLSEYYPDLNQIIASAGNEKLIYTATKFSDILIKILPALRLFGIKALLPKSLQQILYPKVSLNIKLKKENKSFFSLDEMMDFDWQVSVGDTFLNKADFEKLSKQTLGLVKIKDQYIYVTEEEVKKIISELNKPTKPSSFQLLQAALSGDHNSAPAQIDSKLKTKIKEMLADESIALPSSIQANLRTYQIRGFNWMYKNAKLGLGSVLADDMGLGKTLQIITTILKFKEEGLLINNPCLVVVPTTLISNWVNEIQKFAPSLSVHIFHGPSRKIITKNIDVFITTYGVCRTECEKLKKQNWYVSIIDEAQNIKNPEVSQTKSIKSINSKIRIAMSGTPVENRLSEYWSIFDFANPNYLGGLNWFSNEYAKPIEINQDRARLDKFRLITAPFIMRRMKTDKTIISDLPDKIENNQICNLSKEQAALYKNITKDMMTLIENTEGVNRRGLIFKLLITLKQVCNHPSQYLKNDANNPEFSGKTLMLFQLLETIYENNEKVLIFSQFKEMGSILQSMIHKHFGKKALQLHGACTRKERDEMVQAFQNNKWCDTFILSLKAGGTGLNLTAAANVIHYDLWWNPAVESQATDRAFRIGQKQNVMVHRMITKGTLEEKIDEMIKSKKALANLTVSSGEKWLGELSDKELKNIIALE